jgi:beta-glucosidase/6-phospho-beta-glucosidase/beta-galactosidase
MSFKDNLIGNAYKEDDKLMKKIGIKCYRLSVKWARILPKGVDEINQK